MVCVRGVYPARTPFFRANLVRASLIRFPFGTILQKKFSLLFLMIFILLQTISPRVTGFAAPAGQTSLALEKAQALLDTMTPEERVGQLFLVSFQGTEVGSETQIYDLIVQQHIGGVILEAERGNFAPEETLASTWELIQSLQQAESAGAQIEAFDTVTQIPHFPAYIPLFVGISQNGDGYPYDEIYHGLTQLPNPMAIGATWQPDLAEKVGAVAGQELSALGFNLLLGPSLDVLENPNPDSLGDLGVRTFGGDPFWVGLMGSAYIQGVHQGSAGKMAVIAKNFPGYGGSDRPPQEEVSTVRKSLEQLKLNELAAFFAVTGEAASPASTTDGLLLTHIRYQGLQGNIRFTTRPISFDGQAFSTIISLPEFASWREDGGVIITDDLSSRAVRRFYDPTNVNFSASTVAQDAFLAGSDLLYVGNIRSTDDPDSYTSILFALENFTQKYNADLAFALQVDQSVLRILTLKYELYDTFTLENVLPPEETLTTIGNNDAVSFEIARQGVTLISPTLEELESELPEAPTINERIIFVSDTYDYQPCPACPAEATLGKETFRDAVLRLYGPGAGNQVVGQNLYSFTFDDLQTMLNTPGSYHEVEVRMRNAQWLVFSMLDVREDRPISQAFRRFLSERDDLLQNKKVIVFAFNAPYYLDTTDISKLTAYFGMYSKSPQYIDRAARILFKEFTPVNGKLPVSVEGIEYILNEITKPDPQQTISVLLDIPPDDLLPEGTPAENQPPEVVPSPTPLTNFQVGENIPIRTGVILDHNGFPVPDGTVVLFRFDRAGETRFSDPVETVSGIARMMYSVPGGGTLQIGAISEPATLSQPLTLNIPGSEATLEPTFTPTPSPTASSTALPLLTPTMIPTPEPEIERHTQTDFVDWGLGFLITLAVSLLAYRMSISMGEVRWGVRWALCVWIGGLTCYTYLALNLPGSLTLLIERGRAGIIWTISIGAGIGWVYGWIWTLVSKKNKPRPASHPEASTPAKTRSG